MAVKRPAEKGAKCVGMAHLQMAASDTKRKAVTTAVRMNSDSAALARKARGN
jgi:hypothetical protein